MLPSEDEPVIRVAVIGDPRAQLRAAIRLSMLQTELGRPVIFDLETPSEAYRSRFQGRSRVLGH